MYVRASTILLQHCHILTIRSCTKTALDALIRPWFIDRFFLRRPLHSLVQCVSLGCIVDGHRSMGYSHLQGGRGMMAASADACISWFTHTHLRHASLPDASNAPLDLPWMEHAPQGCCPSVILLWFIFISAVILERQSRLLLIRVRAGYLPCYLVQAHWSPFFEMTFQ